MALAEDAKADGLPEEVVAEIEGAEGGEQGGEGQEETPVTFKLSRRKREQQEREERIKAAEERAAAAERMANEIRQQSAQENAHLRGTLEQFQRQFQGFQQQAQAPREQAAEPIERRIAAAQKAAEAALKNSDLAEYHEQMGSIMDLRAEAKAQAILASMPKPPPQAAPVAQKPAWVTAIEFQYPDVLSHPRGQQTVGIVDQLLANEQWGPERLHKAFQRTRAELGLKPAAAAPASNGQRALYGSVNSTATGGGRAPGGEDRVQVKKSDLEMARRFGMTAAQYAKAQKESFPDE